MAEMTLGERIRRKARRELWNPLDARVGGPLRRAWNARRVYRPVFVVGTMGSGTTLAAFSLAQHFDVACAIPESAHQVDRRSFLHTPPVEAFGTVAAYEEAILPGPDWSVERGREDLLHLYRSYAWGPSEVAVDKGPNTNLVRAGFLARCFPEASFLLVFRDPVANIEGFRRKWPNFGRDPLEASIRFYASTHERFLKEAAAFRERVLVLEYETLVEHYDAALARVAERTGLRPARRLRRLPERGNVQGRGIRNVHRSRIGVVRGADVEARRRLGEADARRIEEALAPLRARLCAEALSP